jgi:hypothetical protein
MGCARYSSKVEKEKNAPPKKEKTEKKSKIQVKPSV